jgi:hypothetical protein
MACGEVSTDGCVVETLLNTEIGAGIADPFSWEDLSNVTRSSSFSSSFETRFFETRPLSKINFFHLCRDRKRSYAVSA